MGISGVQESYASLAARLDGEDGGRVGWTMGGSYRSTALRRCVGVVAVVDIVVQVVAVDSFVVARCC